MASLMLAGCADEAEVECETRVEQASELAFKQGHNAAVRNFDLENLPGLAGDRYACKALEIFPQAIQNMAGLDCHRTWPPYIENVSPAFRPGPALIFGLIILLGFGVFYLIAPGFGRFAGEAAAAMTLKTQPLRRVILSQVTEEEAKLRLQLQPLREQIRGLQAEAKTALAEKQAAEQEAEVAQEALNDLREETNALRDELEHRVSLAKKAESTADLAQLLGQIGKK